MRLVASLLILLPVLALDAPGAELYGRPLRGLSPVRIAEILKDPSLYANRMIGIRGTAKATGRDQVSVEDGGALLPLSTDRSFSFPQDVNGAAVRAEGRVETRGKDPARFIVSGVEFSR